MIDIRKHPIWKGSSIWGSISPIKKEGHLFRFFLARQYAKLFPRSMFVGITGSVGKTLTTASCKAVLSEKYKTLATSTSLDPILNIPITILKIRPSIKRVILEMGIEYKGEMEYYLNMVKPAIGILTKVSFAHSEFLGSPEDILSEKGKLIESLPKDGYAILNYDDVLVRSMASKTLAQVIFYGMDSKNCDIWVDKVKVENFGTSFQLNYGVERVEVESQLLGIHQIYGLMAAAALGVAENIPLTQIKRALEKVEAQPHRMQLVPGINGSVIIDDTHNAAFTAMEEALETMNLVPARRRIAVLGEMRELGEFSEDLHRKIARKIYKDKVDLVFLGKGEAQYINDELLKLGFSEDRIQYNLQNPQIASKLVKILGKGDVVLVKGARSVLLGEVVKKITKKGR